MGRVPEAGKFQSLPKWAQNYIDDLIHELETQQPVASRLNVICAERANLLFRFRDAMWRPKGEERDAMLDELKKAINKHLMPEQHPETT